MRRALRRIHSGGFARRHADKERRIQEVQTRSQALRACRARGMAGSQTIRIWLNRPGGMVWGGLNAVGRVTASETLHRRVVDLTAHPTWAIARTVAQDEARRTARRSAPTSARRSDSVRLTKLLGVPIAYQAARVIAADEARVPSWFDAAATRANRRATLRGQNAVGADVRRVCVGAYRLPRRALRTSIRLIDLPITVVIQIVAADFRTRCGAAAGRRPATVAAAGQRAARANSQ